MARIQAFASQHRIGICMAWFGTASTLSRLVLFVALPVFAAQQPATKSSPEFQQVESLIEQGRLDEAKLQMLDQVRRHPSSSEALILLGIVESSEQDYSNAVEAFQKALLIAPDSTKAHNDLGKVYSLGYKPTNEKRDGSWRRVQIQMANRPDLSARSRPGYYAN